MHRQSHARVLFVAVVTALTVGLAPPAAAQGWPPPVDLGIQNVPQETEVWCWVAVVQQIVLHLRGPQATPAQCALVAMANGSHPGVCCSHPMACLVTGHLHQIQGLIQQFGGRPASIGYPTDPMTIYNTLASGRPIIMAVQFTPFAGHVVVIRGMEWVPTAFGLQPVLLINDPLAYFSQPVPFVRIARYWNGAIVVH